MPLFSVAETTFKIDALREQLSGTGAAAALLTANSDLFHFTGSVQKGMLVVPLESAPCYFVLKNVARARRESSLPVAPFDKKAVAAMLSDFPVLGIPFDVTTCAEKVRLEKKFLSNTVDVQDITPSLMLSKMVKHPEEISRIRRAANINRAVMKNVPALFNPGMTDSELQSHIEHYARTELGHQQLFHLRGKNMFAGMCLVVSGPAALTPTYTDFPVGGEGPNPSVAQGPCGTEISDSFLVDFLGAVDGYIADSTRTFFIGPPPSRIRTVYEELHELLDSVIAACGTDMTTGELYDRILEKTAAYSWKDGFMGLDQKVPFFGHGIGSEVNQLPVIAPRQRTRLKNNMVVAVEPKVFLPDYGIVGIEDTWLLDDDGVESLTGKTQPFEEYIIDD